MTIDQINSCGSRFHSEPEPAIDGLDTRLQVLFQSLFDDTTFFTVSLDSISQFVLRIVYNVEHRTAPTTTTDAYLNAAIDNAGDMFHEPSKVLARAMSLREYGPGGWASFFHCATFEILETVKLLDRLG
jgi:hypothetical protein